MKPNNKFSGFIKDIGKYRYWRYEGMWVGYLEEYPEYLSQGETKAELEEGLLKIYDRAKKDDLQQA